MSSDEVDDAAEPEEDDAELLQRVRGRVMQLSLDPQGCRVVQRALEDVPDLEQAILVAELHGHVSDAVESPHANHVLQRCIEVMRPCLVTFILDELVAYRPAGEMARHRYGCRVLERVIEHLPPAAVKSLISELMEEAGELSKHQFGNFVIQHILEHGDSPQRRRVVIALCSEIASIAADPYACGVLDKALTYAPYEDQHRLAVAVLECSGLLLGMACTKRGAPTAEQLLRVARGAYLVDARRQLLLGVDKLKRTKHGRHLLSTFLPQEDDSFQQATPAGVYVEAPGRTLPSRLVSSLFPDAKPSSSMWEAKTLSASWRSGP